MGWGRSYCEGLDGQLPSMCIPHYDDSFSLCKVCVCDTALAYACLARFIPKYLNKFFLRDNSPIIQGQDKGHDVINACVCVCVCVCVLHVCVCCMCERVGCVWCECMCMSQCVFEYNYMCMCLK